MAIIIPFDASSRPPDVSHTQYTASDRLAAIREAFINGLRKKDGSLEPLEKRLAAFDQLLVFPAFQAVYGDLREEYAQIPYGASPARKQKAKVYPFHSSAVL